MRDRFFWPASTEFVVTHTTQKILLSGITHPVLHTTTRLVGLKTKTMSSATASSFPVGARVVLHGLSKAPQYNDKHGITQSGVSSTGRQQVEVFLGDEDEKKVLALKPSNLRYDESMEISALSVKELKRVIEYIKQGNNSDGDDKTTIAGSDIEDLRNYVTEHIAATTTKTTLAELVAKSSSPKSSNTNSNNTAGSAGAGIDMDQLDTQAKYISQMSPDQLQQQASMLQNMDPATIRRMNPAATAHLSDEQIRQQMEYMKNNPSALQNAASQLKHMSPQQREQIMQNTTAARTTTTPSPSPPATANTNTMNMNMNPMSMDQVSPEQLLQQARMMKNMNPSDLRRMNPAMQNFTDEQIKQSIQQMELMASNPSLFEMAKNQMKNLTPEQMQQMQNTMQQPSSSTPSSSPLSSNNMMDDATKLLENMNGKQLKDMLKVVKDNPEMMKQFGGSAMGGSEEQMKKTIDVFDKLSESQLDTAIKVIKGINKVAGPVYKRFQKAAAVVGGTFNLCMISMAVMGAVFFVVLSNYTSVFGGGGGNATATTIGKTILNQIPAAAMDAPATDDIPVVQNHEDYADEFA